MKRFFSLAPLLAMMFILAAAPAMAAKGDKEIIRAASAWLQQVDKGQYTKAYNQAAPHFKQKVTLEKWKEVLAQLEQKTGKANNRKLIYIKKMKDLAGGPKGQYAVLYYMPNFKTLPLVIEQLIMIKVKKKWMMVGFRLK